MVILIQFIETRMNKLKVAVEYCSLIPRPKGSGSETSDAAADLL